jgi:hypothetical protein
VSEMVRGKESNEPLDIDKEPLTPDEEESVREAWEQYKRGKYVTGSKAKRLLGLEGDTLQPGSREYTDAAVGQARYKTLRRTDAGSGAAAVGSRHGCLAQVEARPWFRITDRRAAA